MAVTMKWMIYGANGYTGQLAAEEAARRGLKPVLAGRNADALEALGKRLKLPVRIFALDNPAAVRAGLKGVGLVLHCAGPAARLQLRHQRADAGGLPGAGRALPGHHR